MELIKADLSGLLLKSQTVTNHSSTPAGPPHLLRARREDPGGRLLVQTDLKELLPAQEAVSIEVKLVESSLNLPESLLGAPPARGASPLIRPDTAKEPEVLLGIMRSPVRNLFQYFHENWPPVPIFRFMTRNYISCGENV